MINRNELTIFTGINKMSDDDLRYQVAIIENCNLGNITAEYFHNVGSKISKTARNIKSFFYSEKEKHTNINENINTLNAKIQNSIKYYNHVPREVVMERLLHNLRLHTGYDRGITDKKIISYNVVDKAASYLKINNELPHHEKIESIYRRYLERIANHVDSMLAKQTEEQITSFDTTLEKNISLLSESDKKKMKAALQLEQLTGESVRKAIKTTGATTFITYLFSQFGSYMAAISIVHAVFTVGMGVVLPFGVYTGLSSVLGFLTGPFSLVILFTVGMFNFSKSSQSLDGELLSQIIFFSRASYGRSFSSYSLDNILEDMLDKSRNRIKDLENQLASTVANAKNSIKLDNTSYISIDDAHEMIRNKTAEITVAFEREKQLIIERTKSEMAQNEILLKKQYKDKLITLRQEYMDEYTQKVHDCKELREKFDAIKLEKEIADKQMQNYLEEELKNAKKQYEKALRDIKENFSIKENAYKEEIYKAQQIYYRLQNQLQESEEKYNTFVEKVKNKLNVELESSEDEIEVIFKALDSVVHPILDDVMRLYSDDIEKNITEQQKKYSRFDRTSIEQIVSSQLMYKILFSKGNTVIGEKTALLAALYPSITVTEKMLKKIIVNKFCYNKPKNIKDWTIGSMAHAIKEHSSDWEAGFSKKIFELKDKRNSIMHGSNIKLTEIKKVFGMLFDDLDPKYNILLLLNRLL